MLQALNSLGHNQFETAKWYELGRNKYKEIKVSIVSEREKQFSTVLKNLITTADSTVLKTSYVYNYSPNQEIFYRNTWWTIRAIGEKSLEINPQALRFVNSINNKQIYLELMMVE